MATVCSGEKAGLQDPESRSARTPDYVKAQLAIYVYGDSLSLPRAQDGVRYYDTYPELLREAVEGAYPCFRVALYNRSQGGGFIGGLFAAFLNDGPYFGDDDNGILVIQCGIVDCAPRPVPMSVRRLIGKLPMPLRWGVSRLLHYLRPYLLRHGISWRQTSPQRYRAQLTEWLTRAAPRFNRIYVVNIAPTVPAIATQSPGLSDSIDAFNIVIAAVVRAAGYDNVQLVDVNDAVLHSPHGVPMLINDVDGHHITRLGHKLYAELIWSLERGRLIPRADALQARRSCAQSD